MPRIFFQLFILILAINYTVWCEPQSGAATFRIPAELSNALQLLNPPDRTRFITHCLHLKHYMCSQQEARHYVWGLEESDQFQFSNFWNWYRCTKTGRKDDCPVDGGWSIWSKWAHCDITCGPDGMKSRFRTCDSPRPSNGGRQCSGQTTQITKCNIKIACHQNDSAILSKVSVNYLKMLHRSNPQLKNKCLLSHCSYQEVEDIIIEKEEADKYWSYINCYKHSEGCPVDGKWSEWSEWSRCSSNCGNGHRYHIRSCDSPRPLNAGEMCPGSSLEKSRCFENNCTETVGVHFSPWSHWSHCSMTCGEGVRQSIRRCIGDGACVLGDGTTKDNIIKEVPCQIASCQRQGGWSEWSRWSMCTSICGWGERVRVRTCTNPTPVGSNSLCEGEPFGKERCNHMEASCPINETHAVKQQEYSKWSRWTSCRTTCAGGTMLRHRTCVDDGTNTTCSGPLYDVAVCNSHIPCVVNGGWSEWTKWTVCSKTCKSGFAERYRMCTNPRPAFGGAICSGNSTQRIECQDSPCPEISWAEWGNWTQCTKSCGGGTTNRRRVCLAQDDVVSVARCGGEYKQLSVCSLDPCPVDGNWANWNAWRPCKSSCGEGITSRDRTCTNPAPTGNGNLCDGYGTESRHCYKQPCTQEHQEEMRLFNGKSFIMYTKYGYPTKQVLMYLRLLPESADGLIVMKRHDYYNRQLVYVSLVGGCVYLYAKVGSAELKVVGHPVELFKWNTIQVSITGNLGHVRLNDKYTKTNNFTEKITEFVDYDLPVYLGGCMPHLYPHVDSKATVWSGFVGKIAKFTMNYKLMTLFEDKIYWHGTSDIPYTSLNSDRDLIDIMATPIEFNGEQFSTITQNDDGHLRNIQAIVSAPGSDGLLIHCNGSVSGSFMSVKLNKNKIVLSLNLGERNLEIERDLEETKTWMIVDIQIEPNQVSLRVNKEPASQLSGQDLRFTPSNKIYIGGLPPWESSDPKQGDIVGFTGHIYQIKLNDVVYLMTDMLKQSYDKSVDSSSATLAANFQEHYVIHGASVQLRCRNTEHEHGVEIVWLKENQFVDPAAEHIRLENDNPILPNTTILHLHHIDEEAQGLYACQFRFSNRAEIHQAFAVSIAEPYDVLARTLTEWKISVEVFFAAVVIAIVMTSSISCIMYLCRRPYYVKNVIHTILDYLGFGSPLRMTLADFRQIDRTYFDGQVDIKNEKMRLDEELELSHQDERQPSQKNFRRKLREKKELMLKQLTGRKRVDDCRVSQSGTRYTTVTYSETEEDMEGYMVPIYANVYNGDLDTTPDGNSEPEESVDLIENGNNSGASGRIHHQEISPINYEGVEDVIVNDSSGEEDHQIHHTSSRYMTYENVYAESVNQDADDVTFQLSYPVSTDSLLEEISKNISQQSIHDHFKISETLSGYRDTGNAFACHGEELGNALSTEETCENNTKQSHTEGMCQVPLTADVSRHTQNSTEEIAQVPLTADFFRQTQHSTEEMAQVPFTEDVSRHTKNNTEEMSQVPLTADVSRHTQNSTEEMAQVPLIADVSRHTQNNSTEEMAQVPLTADVSRHTQNSTEEVNQVPLPADVSRHTQNSNEEMNQVPLTADVSRHTQNSTEEINQVPPIADVSQTRNSTENIQIRNNTRSSDTKNDTEFHFKSRALQLAYLLSANGVTPPITESQLTTHAVDSDDDGDTEEEYVDTHE
ncbi:uncharacterized protein [Antedon mediterranea]|uniref:uncharacterized protein n=1 Tax=Antedon mediterranea TaxID=105859 RepID=UPI003AF96FA6